jgi:diguanylate cyclase (GGDEF)-like protein
MNLPVQKAGEDSSETLKLAYEALESGELQTARELAQSVLIAAKARAQTALEAHALACLAHCDRISSRLRRASETSRKAARLFERVGEAAGEANALNTLAHVSTLLGRNDEAVEAALLCIRLCHLETLQGQAVEAHNCLGVAYCWGGNFGRAKDALEEAIRIAARCQPAVSSYQPRLNLAWVEASRLIEERYQSGAMPSLAALKALVERFKRLESKLDGVTLSPPLMPLMPLGGTMARVLEGLLACWQGQLETARQRADLAIRALSGTVTWLDALAHWLVGELAWAERDWVTAEAALREMKSNALSVEHEQLACVGHLLLAQVLEAQGKHEAAKLEHRALRQRERRLSSESLVSREALVAWQMGARQSARHLQQALKESKRFEQWSLEDGLTGIANRRLFEQALAERFEPSAQPRSRLTLAMIDVDRFKSINDTFGHQAGDKVLKALATVLTETVRDNDLPARLAGDEFVVLFDDAGPEVGEEIGQRIRDALARFDWESIAPGLMVSVSIGIANAAEGDTVESLLLRSDRSMYTAKPGWVPTNF